MVVDKTVPWFTCYPSKWLKAIAGMKPHVSLTYLVVCFRIYELDGPCKDTAEVLSRRTGMKKNLIDEALTFLMDAGKLRQTPEGIMNPFAELVIQDRRAARSKNKKWDSHSTKKTQSNQRNADTQLQLEVTGTDIEASKEDSRATRGGNDWPSDYEIQFWTRYPRKVAKAAAMKALARVKKSGAVSWARLLAGLDQFAQWAKTKDIQYVKHPATWINAGCWDDQLTKGEFTNGPPRNSGGGAARHLVNIATGDDTD